MDLFLITLAFLVGVFFWGIFLNGLKATFISSGKSASWANSPTTWRFWAYGLLTFATLILANTYFRCVQ